MIQLAGKHLCEIRNSIREPCNYYKIDMQNIPCGIYNNDPHSYYYNNYSKSNFAIVRGDKNQRDLVIFAHDSKCPICSLMRKNYDDYYEDKLEQLIAIKNSLWKSGYWFMQIMYGKRTLSGQYTTHAKGCEKKHKMVYSTIACSVGCLINFPIYTMINRTEVSDQNLKNNNYYNTITVTATKLSIVENFNKYIGRNKYKYYGFPFMNFNDRVYTYYNPININSIRYTFRNEFYNEDIINSKGFTLSLANDFSLSENNLNYNDSYDYMMYGKMFSIGYCNINNFFAQFINTLQIYPNINTLQAIMFTPNIDVLDT